jgi:FAD/FMN-containing dehydrogenase
MNDKHSGALDETFRTRLATEFSPDVVASDEETKKVYGRDWTKVYAPNPSVVVFPRSVEEVSRLMSLCHTHAVAVVPSGGRTGLAGGAVAASGEVVLSLERMRKMGEIDRLGNTVRVQAGAITQAVHEHCKDAGLTWPVDFASKGSSQVGGNIATNAGGVKVIRYGLTRQWVLGLQAVLADGRIVESGGALEKNNTGLDLRQLFIGSEGIYGIVTAATLKLTRIPDSLDVCLFAVSDLASVLKLFRRVRESGVTVSAYEFFTTECLDRLLRHRALREPFEKRSSHYVLLEIERGASDVDTFFSSLFADGLVQDGVVAQSSQQAAELWALREGISESLSATGLPHKNDVALPVAALEAFCAELDAVFSRRYPGWEICLFGHIGDGNLHINIMKPDAMDKAEFLARAKEADVDMFTLVKSHGGSISAEHGVGLLKKASLHFTRSEEEIALMRQVKRALDPKGILNPGKVFDLS